MSAHVSTIKKKRMDVQVRVCEKPCIANDHVVH